MSEHYHTLSLHGWMIIRKDTKLHRLVTGERSSAPKTYHFRPSQVLKLKDEFQPREEGM